MSKSSVIKSSVADGSFGHVVRDDNGRLESIQVFLGGELPTCRGTGFDAPTRKAANKFKRQVQERWFVLLCYCGDTRMLIYEFQRQNVANRLRTRIEIETFRGRKYKDKKNLYVATDELLIDAMVGMNVLYDDCEGNIELLARQGKRAPDMFDDGPYVRMCFTRMDQPPILDWDLVETECSPGTYARWKKEQAEESGTTKGITEIFNRQRGRKIQ